MENKTGINLTVGAMATGKSKEIIDTFYNNQDGVIFFQPVANTRDGSFIRSRAYKDKAIKATPFSIENLNRTRAKQVVIEEYQMLNDTELQAIIDKSKETEINCYGLNMYANRQYIEPYKRLAKVAKRITIIKGKCGYCGKENTSIYSNAIRVKGNDWVEGKIEDGKTEYKPCCETCASYTQAIQEFESIEEYKQSMGNKYV